MPGEDYQSWSTTAANNGAIDSAINFAEGQPRASINNSSRSQMAALAKNRNLLNGSIVTGGTTNAQTFTSGVGYTTVPTGLLVRLKIGPNLSSVAGTATTLNMDGIGAVNIKTQKGDNVTSGLLAGTYVNFLYDGTNWIWLDSGVGNTTTIITSVIVSSTATGPIALVDFTDLDSNKFARYQVVITNLIPEIDGATLVLSFSTDNGVTFPIDIRDYSVVESYMSGGRIDVDGTNFVTAVQYGREYQALAWSLYATAPQYPGQILLDLFNLKAGVSPAYYWNSGSYEPVFEGAQLDNGWGFVARTGCNAIRLWPSEGNIISGTFTLYGSN